MLRSKREKRKFSASDAGWRVSVSVATVSGVFSLCVATLLVVNYFQVVAINPLDNPEMAALRRQLAESAAVDEKLVAEIQAMDLLARKAFFTSQDQLRTGGCLLTGAVVVLLVSLRLAARFRPRLPQPAETPPPDAHYWLTRSRARELLLFCGALWLLAALAAAYFVRDAAFYATHAGAVDEPAAAAVAAPDAVPAQADWETVRKNWPSFRGPGGVGVAAATRVPIDWDLASGRNVLWTAEPPLGGTNSPVVWEKRLYLSGATDTAREVFCFDTETGALLWRYALQPMPGTPEKPPKVTEETSFAAPTMAAQGNLACALFGNGDLVCLDDSGTLKWGRNLGVPDNHYGHSSSLLAHGGTLIVQYDQKRNGKLLALDLADGREVWAAPRTHISWASPACVETPFGWQLLLNSSQDVSGYDPLSGELLWRLECLDAEVATSPAYANGTVFAANDMTTAVAIRFEKDGAEPKPAIAWQYEDLLPDVSSPVGTGRHFFMATSRGEIVCLDAETGAETWMQEFDEGFYASPILAGDRIYAVDKAGTTIIFKAAGAYELVGAPRLDEETVATPAFVDGRIYVRTQSRLVCIAAS